MVPVEFRKVLFARLQEDRQVGPGNDVGAGWVQAGHQILIMRVEFRGPAGEVHRENGVSFHHPDNGVDGGAFHLFRAYIHF